MKNKTINIQLLEILKFYLAENNSSSRAFVFRISNNRQKDIYYYCFKNRTTHFITIKKIDNLISAVHLAATNKIPLKIIEMQDNAGKFILPSIQTIQHVEETLN